MRAAAIAVIACVLVATGARGASAGGAARGFDHRAHAEQAGTRLPCARCHAGPGGLGTPGHAACFAACHGGTGGKLGKLDPAARACTVCHADPDAAKPVPVTFPLGHDLAPSLAHAAHATVRCESCHAAALAPAAAATAPKPHARCAGCHDGTAGHGTPMSACETCHVAGRAPPRVIAADVPLAYAHAPHAARAGAAEWCATCHAGVPRVAAGESLPRAPASACETCHDGTTAFSFANACTRCHAAAPTTPWTPPKPGPRFSHVVRAHAAIACASCHALTAAGEPIVAHHDACAGAGCHDLHADAQLHGDETDGTSRKAICGACHEGTEPWRHLVADRAPRDATELGASLDHGVHGGACTSCHTRRTPIAELQLPHGHAACSAAGCHAVSGGPAPTLATCDGCHRTGLAAERIAERTAAPWSVRATFAHARHEARAKLACADCHAALAGAQLLATPTPAKATCAPCHDGHTAFKLTGTTCRRCHSRGL